MVVTHFCSQTNEHTHRYQQAGLTWGSC